MDPGESLSELAERPILRSVLGGGAAYAGGILAVGALNPVDRDGSNPVAFAANRFYSAHFGQLDRTVRGPPGSDIGVNAVASPAVDASELSPFVFYAIPIAVLLLAGYRLAQFEASEDQEVKALLGAGTVLGYLPATVLGTFVVTATWSVGSGEVTAVPELELWTVLVMGIGYPLVFGGIGGAIRGVTGGRS